MKKINYFLMMLLASFTLASCEDNTPENDPNKDPEVEEAELSASQLEREPFFTSNPMADEEPIVTVKQDEPTRLSFFGWSPENDAVIKMTMPETTEYYNRAILTYRMGAWNKGPGDWDMTTQITILDKKTGEYYEIARAFTPYGGSFGSTWNKTYYMDVTEFLPMLEGDCEFRVFYGGWDATDTKAHTVSLAVDFYAEAKRLPRTIYSHKIYDSRYYHNGYRGWTYGQESKPIESDTTMGLRTFKVPEGVESLLLRVSITGHGQEQGVFPDRDGYRTRNAAEFDYNYYDVIVNGENFGKGYIYYENGDNYPQAGTCYYDRANWGPGWPANVQYWKIEGLPSDGEMTLDIDLERYIGKDVINDYTAYYIVQVDVFGMDRAIEE